METLSDSVIVENFEIYLNGMQDLEVPTFYRHQSTSVRPEDGGQFYQRDCSSQPQLAKIIPISTELLQNTDITRCIRESLCQSDELGSRTAGPSIDVRLHT